MHTRSTRLLFLPVLALGPPLSPAGAPRGRDAPDAEGGPYGPGRPGPGGGLRLAAAGAAGLLLLVVQN